MRITLRFEALDGRLNLPTNYNYTLHGFIYNKLLSKRKNIICCPIKHQPSRKTKKEKCK